MLTLFIGCLVSPGEYKLLLEDAQDADNDGEISEVYGGPDCDDADHAIHSQAEELCDQIDDDCDGVIDEGLPTETWYLDADRDGFGDSSTAIERCSAPEDHVLEPGDCDDTEDDVNPSVPEVCDDGVDNNCDGGAPECVWAGEYDLARADAVVRSEAGLDYFGLTVAVLDTNGDGMDEIAVGSPFRDQGSLEDAGSVYLFDDLSGSYFAHEVASWSVPGNESKAGLGLYSQALRDLNGDGYSDLAVGGDDRYGQVRVWLGGESGLATDHSMVFFAPEAGRTSWGEGLADVQLDDHSNALAIGAPDASTPAVYLWFSPTGEENPAETADLIIEGEGVGENAHTTQGADFDGDGKGDLILLVENQRSLFLAYGPLERGVRPVSDLDLRIDASDHKIGVGLATGDLNEDGYDDYAASSTDEGTVYIHHGGSEREWADHLADTSVVLETGFEGGGYILTSGSLASESDLLVTVPQYIDGGWQGTHILVYSSPIQDGSSPDVTATADGRYCGYGVDTGDFDGDGVQDLVVTCPLAEDRGLAFIQFGAGL